ncbi:MAG TPA: BadF/BadG/BcrA/BcrD ATPase family protein [Pseudonocardia sp.]|nr:BadF/BadG/BcrA/BcrD ATPase family protein [Pseudonocardia sp.]
MTGRFLGLDIGGSKTHAVLADPTGVRAEAVVGSANIASVGVREATRQLTAVLDGLGVDELGATAVEAVCAGAAGADSPEQRHQLTDLIAGLLPTARVQVVHDTQLLLAAAGLDDGIALIAGTGSVAWGINPDGRSHRAGGWGYLLGDEGSGYGVARAAVRHVLDLADRAAAPDTLTAALVAGCGLTGREHLLERFYANPERRYWARQAGVVFELAVAGDPVAVRIVDEAAAALTALVRTVAGVLDRTGPVVCAGGLITHRPALLTRLRDTLAADGVTDVRLLDRDPVHGAVRIALRACECSAVLEHG